VLRAVRTGASIRATCSPSSRSSRGLDPIVW
jgi:hypothetical protein